MNSFYKMQLIYENLRNQYIIGYHGTDSSEEFNRPNIKGIWFAEEESGIMDYYANRSGQRKIIKANIFLGNNLDLTMYNADEMMDDQMAEEFINDIELGGNLTKQWIDILFFGNFETDYDDFGDPTLPASMILNAIIEHEIIPRKLYDSVSILEANDEVTHAILKTENIQIIK